MTWRQGASLVGSALLLAGAAAGITYSMLGGDAALAMPLIRSGDLDIELVGIPKWTETSPGVTPVHTSGMQQDKVTAAHLATPGDAFTLRQQFRVRLTGDRMAARVNVHWAREPELHPAGGVTATYVVTLPDGTSCDPVAVGSPVTLPGGADAITAADLASWGTAPWSVTVSLVYTGTSSVVVAPSAVGSQVTDLGAVVVELAQVRAGEGFR